ncbi:uncharacterized protein PGTG_09673 [Puccinia graminis f. sp. tritici CRL 75-36-700-3]|uniref:Uncharacterized protein n=1 Tax=Puccinia graminis f. sp. tritici (strain CRL 75-36-700-3 / race SCCL) TaxID=418459 RepID=E3KI35_PUCGT|nr:uncharacterized protein PGTG_09673 [Puccinia graminis f. sp. tritici CRL 75-36-700-3]EFP83960.1 hypothetical protein PGTG_09673 [Puccinia graminis f. sp. tritici CRL 75-36-700-3]
MDTAAMNMIKIFFIHYGNQEKDLSAGSSSVYAILRNWKTSHYRTFLEGRYADPYLFVPGI